MLDAGLLEVARSGDIVRSALQRLLTEPSFQVGGLLSALEVCGKSAGWLA